MARSCLMAAFWWGDVLIYGGGAGKKKPDVSSLFNHIWPMGLIGLISLMCY